jgi:hypothetical protein
LSRASQLVMSRTLPPPARFTNVGHRRALPPASLPRGTSRIRALAPCTQTDQPLPLPSLQYDPIIREHVLFNEAKMPKSKGGRRAGK